MGLEPTHLSIPEPKSGAATNYAKGANMVLEAGIEPARLASADFKSAVATDYTTRALVFQLYANTPSGVRAQPVISL